MRIAPTKKEIVERKKRAADWKEFRKKHIFSQERLAETMGISRRAVQYIEAAKVKPTLSILNKFRIIKLKYERQGR